MLVIFSMVLIAYKLFDNAGLIAFTVIATISANIEVLILVDAFGMSMTLGNILFASTFLVTDILSEVSGKKAANKAVNIGIMTSIFFIIISQSWLLYIPNGEDWAAPSIVNIFKTTPRLMLSSLVVYAIVQKFDVFMFHKWWDFTAKKWGDKRKYLWIRNNGSTLLSQLLNTILFNIFAFAGMYNTKTLISIIVSGYVIFIVTSLCDTPFVYLARKIHEGRIATK
jgi:uncharacterized integral membrane protein (TIGR00697 family)